MNHTCWTLFGDHWGSPQNSPRRPGVTKSTWPYPNPCYPCWITAPFPFNIWKHPGSAGHRVICLPSSLRITLLRHNSDLIKFTHSAIEVYSSMALVYSSLQEEARSPFSIPHCAPALGSRPPLIFPPVGACLGCVSCVESCNTCPLGTGFFTTHEVLKIHPHYHRNEHLIPLLPSNPPLFTTHQQKDTHVSMSWGLQTSLYSFCEDVCYHFSGEHS